MKSYRPMMPDYAVNNQKRLTPEGKALVMVELAKKRRRESDVSSGTERTYDDIWTKLLEDQRNG